MYEQIEEKIQAAVKSPDLITLLRLHAQTPLHLRPQIEEVLGTCYGNPDEERLLLAECERIEKDYSSHLPVDLRVLTSIAEFVQDERSSAPLEIGACGPDTDTTSVVSNYGMPFSRMFAGQTLLIEDLFNGTVPFDWSITVYDQWMRKETGELLPWANIRLTARYRGVYCQAEIKVKNISLVSIEDGERVYDEVVLIGYRAATAQNRADTTTILFEARYKEETDPPPSYKLTLPSSGLTKITGVHFFSSVG